MMEYTWNVQCPEEDGPRSKMVSIFDVKGIQLTDFAGDALQFLKTAIATTSAHYPERAVNIVIINAPWIFSSIWGLVKGMVPPATQIKVRIAAEGEQTTEVMRELIDPDQIPEEYGGTFRPGNAPGTDGTYCRYHSEQETAFRKFVHGLNQGLSPSQPSQHTLHAIG